MARADIQMLVAEGKTAEQIAAAIKSDAKAVAQPARTREEIESSMVEQGMDTQPSGIGDLQLAYNKGVIDDQMYADIYAALGI